MLYFVYFGNLISYKTIFNTFWRFTHFYVIKLNMFRITYSIVNALKNQLELKGHVQLTQGIT